MAAISLRLDQDGAIKALTEETSLNAEDAAGIVRIISRFLVIPAYEKSASKSGEAAARGRITTRVNKALEDLDALVTRVTSIEAEIKVIKETMATTMATKKDLSDLKFDVFKWLVPILFGQAAMIVGLLKLVGGS